MESTQSLFEYLLRIGDNALILGQRLSEWCGHGPVLEQDIAITNIALDHIGQARSILAYAGGCEGQGHNEDQIAYLRDAWDFRNILLVELPNQDWAFTIIRQFLFDSWNYYFHQDLLHSTDKQISAIAEKSLKEIAYHLRFSAEWVIRLGDGTDVSHEKMQIALDDLWTYSGEMQIPDALDLEMRDLGIGADLEKIKPLVDQKRKDIFREATLQIPADEWMQQGGKQGRHTEHLGFILADMQFMQRAYPNMHW